MKNNRQQQGALQRHEAQYKAATAELLLVIVLTLVNIVLYFGKSGTVFLFSATVPYVAAVVASVSYYSVIRAVAIPIAAVSLLAYLLCFWLARGRRYGALLAALILFALDTVAAVVLYFVSGDPLSGLLDLVIHGMILYQLIVGVRAGIALSRTPTKAYALGDGEDEEGDGELPADTVALRYADMAAKARIFLEVERDGYRICYRRVKRTNELVVNGRVYAEYVALLERAHELIAYLDGHRIVAEFDNIKVYLRFDDELLAEKRRLI